MKPELKRAIIKYIPNYFTWESKRQEEFRATIPRGKYSQIRQFFMEKMYGLSIIATKEDDVWDSLTDAQHLEVNSALLLLTGIGEDYFYLNENFADNTSILSFTTLYDYDLDDFEFQEESRKESNPKYQRQPYYGSLYFTWARLMVDGHFSYAGLSMLSGYIYEKIDEFGNELIKELIPFEYKTGKKHGKLDGDGYIYDMVTCANGLESQLDELTNRLMLQLHQTYKRLQYEFDNQARHQVFILDTSTLDDPSLQFVFTDKDILSRIFFKTFMGNCRKVEEQDHSILFRLIEKEKKDVKFFLEEQYEDLLNNFDNKIVKFKRRTKIIVHKDSGLINLFDR